MSARLFLFTLAFCILAAGLAGCGGSGDPRTPGRSYRQAPRPDTPDSLFTGTASCSGRSCHGGLQPQPQQLIGQHEYTVWLSHDRHAGAYAKLFDDRSKRIARNLRLEKNAHEEHICLSCHVTPYAADEWPNTESAKAELHFGVGCESCHGAAGKWLAKHSGGKWKDYDAVQKRRDGFVPTTDLTDLGRACAGCHVGAPPGKNGVALTRDVTHDLIAAGHPRLNFELSVFVANLPPHWNQEAKEKTRDPNVHEARQWALGQLASAEAALELLEYRAKETSRPWPEFAEYDCFACHHELRGEKNWRQNRDPSAGRRLGALPWGTWHFTMSRLIGDGLPVPEMSFRKSLVDLEKLMMQPAPVRIEAATRARAAVKGLDNVRKRLATWDANLPEKWLRSFGQDKRLSMEPSWDAAMQLYLAVYVLDPKQRQAINKFERAFAFPKDVNSPATFDRDQFQELLKHLPR